MNVPCLVCQRIPPKIVFFYAHSIFDKFCPRELIHQIAIQACDAINYADKKKRIFFCGKTQLGILSGLFYLLAVNSGRIRITQIDLAASLPYCYGKQNYRYGPSNKPLTEVTLRNNYKQWLNYFPELFSHLNEWICKCGTWNSNALFFCSKCHELSKWEGYQKHECS